MYPTLRSGSTSNIAVLKLSRIRVCSVSGAIVCYLNRLELEMMIGDAYVVLEVQFPNQLTY